MNNDKFTLIFEIEYIIKYLKSDKLTEKDNNKLTEYLNILSLDELKVFKQLAEQFKYNKKYLGWNKYKISKNAIDLTLKILKYTEIKVFPYIDRIARKGFDISGGTFAWGMEELNINQNKIYSDIRTNICLKKCYELEYDIYNSKGFITIKETN